MPQATDELRKEWGGAGGVGADKAHRHLLNKGFTFDRKGFIHPPQGGYDYNKDTEDTWGAVCFLCDEWDYGYEGDRDE